MDDLYKSNAQVHSSDSVTNSNRANKNKEQEDGSVTWLYTIGNILWSVTHEHSTHYYSQNSNKLICIPRHSQLVEELYLESIFN